MYPISCVKSCLFQSGGQKTRKCDQSDIPFHLILSFQNVSLTTSDNRRENMLRLFLNCLGRNQDCFPPYILYTLVTIHYSHKGYNL